MWFSLLRLPYRRSLFSCYSTLLRFPIAFTYFLPQNRRHCGGESRNNGNSNKEEKPAIKLDGARKTPPLTPSRVSSLRQIGWSLMVVVDAPIPPPFSTPPLPGLLFKAHRLVLDGSGGCSYLPPISYPTPAYPVPQGREAGS